MSRFHITTLALVISSPVLITGLSASAQKLITTSPASEQGAPQQPIASQSTFEDIRPSGTPIVIGSGLGTVIRLPGAAKTVFVADPDVADVQLTQSDLIYLLGKKGGATMLTAVDHAGKILLNKVVQVKPGPVTIIRGAGAHTGGEPAPGPVVLQIPLQSPAATPAATTPAASTR